MGFFVVILVAFFILMLAAQWKIYSKAGKAGWAAFIPIYNLIVLLEMIGKPMSWFIFLCIPFVNIYFSIKATHLLSKSFGKDTGFTLGLLFLPFIFIPMLGLGAASYQGPAGLDQK